MTPSDQVPTRHPLSVAWITLARRETSRRVRILNTPPGRRQWTVITFQETLIHGRTR